VQGRKESEDAFQHKGVPQKNRGRPNAHRQPLEETTKRENNKKGGRY